MGTAPKHAGKAIIETNKGNIVCNLFPIQSPKTVDNFVKFSENKFYDNLIFHRVIPNFMIQGGCPLGTGTGGPGYKFEDEISDLSFNRPGRLAMANSGPNTNGSQFFITTAPTPWLDGKHTIFGQVVEGQDVVDAISMVKRNAMDKPTEDVVIKTIKIEYE